MFELPEWNYTPVLIALGVLIAVVVFVGIVLTKKNMTYALAPIGMLCVMVFFGVTLVLGTPSASDMSAANDQLKSIAMEKYGVAPVETQFSKSPAFSGNFGELQEFVMVDKGGEKLRVHQNLIEGELILSEISGPELPRLTQ